MRVLILVLLLSNCSAMHRHHLAFKAHLNMGVEIDIGDSGSVGAAPVCAVP